MSSQDEEDFTSPQHHYKRIEGFVTGDCYVSEVKETIPVSTKVHHVLEEAEKLVTDALYDLMEEMNRERIGWLRIDHQDKAFCYKQMLDRIEEKIRSVKHPRC